MEIIFSLIGVIIGASISGYFTIKATTKELKHQREVLVEQEKIIEKSILQSIYDEMECLYKRYMNVIGNKIASLNSKEALLLNYPLSDDFFVFYRANTFAIGKITDSDLRKQIIETYISAKSLVETLKTNNELFKKYEE